VIENRHAIGLAVVWRVIIAPVGAFAPRGAIAFAGIGVLLLTIMAVYLLHEFFDLTLWGSYGIVGIVLLVLGAGCLYGARTRE
jgi:hypothetical protein